MASRKHITQTAPESQAIRLLTPEKVKTILAMRKRHSVAEISQRVKLSKSAIYNVLKQTA